MDSFHVYLSRKLPQLLLLHAPDLSPKTVCSHPHRWIVSAGFRSKKHIFSHPWPGRTELGKAGKEHRGIFRVHQFLQIDVWSGWNQPSGVVGFGKFQMACCWSLTLANLVYGLFVWWMKLNHAASRVVRMFISRWYPLELERNHMFLHVWVHQWIISSCVGGCCGLRYPQATSWCGWIFSEVREGGAVLYHHWRQGCLPEDATLPKKILAVVGIHLRSLTARPWKMLVGRLLS